MNCVKAAIGGNSLTVGLATFLFLHQNMFLHAYISAVMSGALLTIYLMQKE